MKIGRVLFSVVTLFSFLGSCGLLHAGDQRVLDYRLEVSIDVHSSKIQGVASIRLKAGDTILVQRGLLRIRDMQLGGKSLKTRQEEKVLLVTAARSGMLRIRYEGLFRPYKESIGREHLEHTSLISEEGVSLTGTWYPRTNRLCRYHLTATLPEGFEAVSEAEVNQKKVQGGKAIFTFQFPYPLDEMTLVASDRYEVQKDRFGNVDILAYFFPADAGLARTYIERTKEYLKLYGEMLGPYPYKRFSVVENLLPTGYSMPTFTLLGQDVVRLPFIPETSLGHEILHQWFGNLVYIDYAKGNWGEGLTTYLADHLFEERKNAGPAYRKSVLIDYQSYVHEKNEFPLADFRGRTDNASKAIGYGKAAMAFHMLKKHVGDDVFLRSLRYFISAHRHSRASWEDLQDAFEKESGKNLARFFRQWVHEKGLPDLSPEDAKSTQKDSGWEASSVLVQGKRPYVLDVPVTLSWQGGKKTESFQVEQQRTRIVMDSGTLPERISLDARYDVARKLSRRELPPVIARLLGSEKTLLVPSPARAETYTEVVETFLQRGAVLGDGEALGDADLAGASLILLGADNPVTLRLFGATKTEGDFSVIVKENPLNPAHVAAIVSADSQEAVASAFGKIFHYGRYSQVAFEHGKNIGKRVDETENGVTREVAALPRLDQSSLDTLTNIITQTAAKKIIYAGETYDHFSHHLVQLEIIKALHRQGRAVSIGMEMFQRPAQRALDDYIAGEIDGRQFLKESRYFKGWGFDYNLYRPILDFARAEGIPVVALNVEHEIVSKVFRGGLDSLTPQEKAKVPAQLDFSDKPYKERLRKVFEEHNTGKEERFDFFYQAQVLWDEAMAESIVDFLQEYPAYQMVVLAGNGHLAHKSGIPARVARRDTFESAVILNGIDFETGAADYLLSPQPVAYTPAPKLMVFLTEEKGKVAIQSFPESSISEKAGMKAGDSIRSIDGVPVRYFDDVRIELLFHKKGDTIRVQVLRKELSGDEKGIEFELVL
jgi:aminopeptidase N